jgi:predicted ATPase/DNA-binding CsgD family transcriptional regulator
MQAEMIVLPKPSQDEELRFLKYTLPIPLTPLVGHHHTVTDICRLLRRPTVRLLTLTGTAGVGKTRLSLQVAAAFTNVFVDGVCFVSLALLRDPEFVLPTVAQALKLPEARDRSPLEHLQISLWEQHLLLLLDNFEQVAEAAPFLVTLLQSCPNLKIMLTSRVSLRVRGEYEVRIPPLDLPDCKLHGDLATLTQNAAVTLFIQRLEAQALDFTLTEANAATIAEICVRLDGLPLAIELAAARIKLLSPHQLLSRLTHRLASLTGGTQDLPVRQQTLRNTLQWSYDLLNPAEQWLFRLLSVFVGGCTVEAVEALCQTLQDGMIGVLDGLQRLLDHNLIFESKQPDGEMRLMMLETLREYGQECLIVSNEVEITQRAHAEYYLALVEEAEPRLFSSEQLCWLERLEQEFDNLRTAVQYLLQQEQKVLCERWVAAPSLARLGEVAAAQGQFVWAARLWGATEGLCETLGTSLVPIDRAAYESAVATTSMHLGEEAFTALWTEGRSMSLDQVLTDQESTSLPRLACTAQSLLTAPPPASDTGRLTPREMDVLHLLTQGLTSAQIAKQLAISVVTVNFHVRSIYRKLGVSSRSAATRYAIEHRLA